MAHVLIAAAIAAASAAAVPAPFIEPAPIAAPNVPDASPALWVVNDADTVIYLFGTFHALDGKTAWFNDEVATAFDASDELVLETIVPHGPRPRPAPRSNAPTHRINPATASASFLASTRMAISAGRSRGLKVGNGADMVLRDAAETSGKAVHGLESFEFQVGMFSRMPDQPAEAPRAGEAVNAEQNPRTMENLSIVMSQMQAAWNRGESDIFALMLNQMRTNSPETYHVLFTQRNANWAGWIAQRLQQPGTVFVAVGAGHLAGNDSVQAKLAERGVRSARVN